jgi:ABC-2 type transport system ATP-binding protein
MSSRSAVQRVRVEAPAVGGLAVRGLTKAYGGQRAVDDLTFTVEPGKVTGFLGPNGAGKSTTLRMVLGLVHPTAGSSTVAGRPYGAHPVPVRAVGALLDTEQFHPGRSGRDALRVLTAASGLPDRRVEEVLAEVELTGAARKKVGHYSLGMRQRLGIAAALLGEPEVLVLDEPANGLDPAGMRWLREFLRGYAERGRTVFVSSHQLGEVAQMADEAVVIARGRLVTVSSVAGLLAGGEQEVTVQTWEPERLLALLTEAGIAARRTAPEEVLAAADPRVVGAAAAAGRVPVFAMSSTQRNLEDVFFELTGEGAAR